MPNPITVGDELLVAVIDELRGLRADLRSAAPSARQSPVVAMPAESPERELREPKPARARAAKKRGS